MIVFNGAHRVLMVNRKFNVRDPALPGGDSEPEDLTPAKTAIRELFEETGLRAMELICVDKWEGERGQPVFAFFVPKWKGSHLRSSSEGKPYWAYPQKLLVMSAKYRDIAQRLLEKIKAAA